MEKIIQDIIDAIHQKKDYEKAAQLILEHQIRLEELIEKTYKLNFSELAQLIDTILQRGK